jgi:UDP-glucose 4-epimerase
LANALDEGDNNVKVLVTGGAGFIGSHVVDVLLEAGHQVAIVDNLWEHGGGRIENLNPRATFYKMDVCDSALVQVFETERPEAICHLAAQHSVKISTDDPVYDAQVNILGLINLMQCATKFGSRKIVFSSSGATYGTADKMPVDEHTPQKPESPYGITKLASEHYLAFWKAMYGLDFTALRYGNVYGPRQDPTGEAGVIAIFARQVILGLPVRIDWDGEQQKDYVYARDVARANLLALTRGSGQAYCIATGAGTSVNALYRGLADLIGKECEIVRAPKRPGDIYLTYFDCAKAARELDWRPQVDLHEGLRLTAEFFRATTKS